MTDEDARAELARLARGPDALALRRDRHVPPAAADRGAWTATAPFEVRVHGPLDELLATSSVLLLCVRFEALPARLDRVNVRDALRGLNGIIDVTFDIGERPCLWIHLQRRMVVSPWDAWLRSIADLVLVPFHALSPFSLVELGPPEAFPSRPQRPPPEYDGPRVAWLVRLTPPTDGAAIRLDAAPLALGSASICLVHSEHAPAIAVMRRGSERIELDDGDVIEIDGVAYAYKSTF
jgi:hypothetical protein